MLTLEDGTVCQQLLQKCDVDKNAINNVIMTNEQWYGRSF
jgi:hypothetical protein